MNEFQKQYTARPEQGAGVDTKVYSGIPIAPVSPKWITRVLEYIEKNVEKDYRICGQSNAA